MKLNPSLVNYAANYHTIKNKSCWTTSTAWKKNFKVRNHYREPLLKQKESNRRSVNNL